MIDLDKLSELAKAAKPGRYIVGRLGNLGLPDNAETRRFINTATPQVVLDLISEIRLLREGRLRGLECVTLVNQLDKEFHRELSSLKQKLGLAVEALNKMLKILRIRNAVVACFDIEDLVSETLKKLAEK